MSSPPPPLQARRKGPKQLPRLPLSAFSPPNTGSSETFPLPPSPSTLNPDKVLDAHVVADPQLERWQTEVGQSLGDRVVGAILFIPALDAPAFLKDLNKNPNKDKIKSLVITFALDDPASLSVVDEISSPVIPISFATTFSTTTPGSVAVLQEVLKKGRPVDIEIQTSISDTSLERFEDFLTKATADLRVLPPIILSNILPPPHDLSLPIVKLMNHPSYLDFQAKTAALSLFPTAYVKYLPPAWGEATPPALASDETTEGSGIKEQREWKRRIKMYLGPIMEAFGYERIIFGGSPPSTSDATSNSGDWYKLARESFAELGVEQEFVDSVFCRNAEKVYC